MFNIFFGQYSRVRRRWKFLEEFRDIIDAVTFKSRLKSQTGSIWSSKPFIVLTRKYFQMEMKEVKSSRFLQNALENIFSITDSLQTKPSAQNFIQSLRSVSIKQFAWNPVNGSFAWDHEINTGKCFLDMLDRTQNLSQEGLNDFFEEEIKLQLDFEKNDVKKPDEIENR